MKVIVPTILAPTREAFEKRLKTLRPHFYKAQIDVLNNTLIPNQSFADAGVIGSLAGIIQFEVHLMVTLEEYPLSQWFAPWVEKIILHVEASARLDRYAELVRSNQKKIFFALNPETETSVLDPYLSMIDGVLFMTVHPGHMGSPFVPEVLTKIQEFHERHPSVAIEVDGAVTPDTLPSLLSVGVEIFAVGSYLDGEYVEERLFEMLSILERGDAKQTA